MAAPEQARKPHPPLHEQPPTPGNMHNPRWRKARGDPVQTSSCRVPSHTPPPPECRSYTRGESRRKAPSGGRGEGRAGSSPGRWGRSGCRRLGTPRGSPPPRSPGRRRGWQQPSLKSRSATFSVALGPHPHGPPAHARPPRPRIRPSRAQSVPAAGWERGTRPPQAGGVSHQETERLRMERPGRARSAMTLRALVQMTSRSHSVRAAVFLGSGFYYPWTSPPDP